MRRIAFAVAALFFASSLLGCPLLKKKKSGDDDLDLSALADASTTTVSGTGAKNEANVLRYANETPLANEPAVIGKDGTKVRNFPGNGPEVATLSKGTAVAKLAKYFNTGVLVMFDDPASGGKLIGWVVPTAFDVAAVPTKPVIVPPKVDAGSKVPPIPTPGPVPTVPTTPDAGIAKVDSGAPPVVVKDAGAGVLPQPPAGVLAVQPVDGKCPQGWSLSGPMCRRMCNADGDCPRGISCVQKHCTTQ